MVNRRSIKRARSSSPSETDHPPNPPVSDEYIVNHLRALDSNACRSLLLEAAREHPEILEAIETRAAPLVEAAISKGLRFHDHASSVYYMLHYFGDNPKIPEKYDIRRERYVTSEIEVQVDNIEDACPIDASFGTKRNALVALRQICEHIYTANTPVGEKIRSAHTNRSLPEDVILSILKGMTRKERGLLKVQGPNEHWLYELASLVEEATREGLFCSLFDAVRMVGGPGYNVRDQETLRKNQTLAWRSRMRIGKELRKTGDRMSGITDVRNCPVPEWAT